MVAMDFLDDLSDGIDTVSARGAYVSPGGKYSAFPLPMLCSKSRKC